LSEPIIVVRFVVQRVMLGLAQYEMPTDSEDPKTPFEEDARAWKVTKYLCTEHSIE
jgi:hypothetical protein